VASTSRSRGEFVVKLIEYGVVTHSLHSLLSLVTIVVCFALTSGIPVYSTPGEPVALGKITALSILLLLGVALAEILWRLGRATQVKTKRKITSTTEHSNKVLVAILVLAVIATCYLLICFYRAY
jgi:cytochrome b561